MNARIGIQISFGVPAHVKVGVRVKGEGLQLGLGFTLAPGLEQFFLAPGLGLGLGLGLGREG